MTRLTCTAALALLGMSAQAQNSGDIAAPIIEYTAVYAAQYKGRNVGKSVFTLQRDTAARQYVFSSTLQASGLLRLVTPRPVVDRAEFRLEDGAIVPLRFLHEDGSRKGEDNHTIDFDWERMNATVAGVGYTREIPLNRDALDRGSLQVALMLTLRAGVDPQTFQVLDEESIDGYSYVSQGSNTVTTDVGELETLRFRQQRAGSSRYTLIDFAPALEFVPARIEQFRDGESQSSFQLESFERI